MLNSDLAVRQLLTDALRSCPLSRQQVAEEMSRILGCAVTLSMINDFTASSRNQEKRKFPIRFPAAWVGAFCAATGDDRLRRYLLGDHLGTLLDLGERAFAAIQGKPLPRRQRARQNCREQLSRGLFENSAVVEISTSTAAKEAVR
jgi:hypothetical protein